MTFYVRFLVFDLFSSKLFSVTQIRHNWDIRLNSEHTHFVFVDYRDSETSDEKSYQKQMEVTLDLKTRFEAHVHWKGRQPEKKAEKEEEEEEEEAAKAKAQQDGNPEDDNQQIQRTVNKNDICKSCVFVEVHESKTFHMSFLEDQVRNAIRLFGEFQLNIIEQFRTTVLKIRSREN